VSSSEHLKQETMRTPDLDLLIVGAGPAGMLASAIASKLGLSNRIIENRSGLHTEPSAHVIKTHSMEVFRRLGLESKIHALSTPASLQRWATWCESIAGITYGRLDLLGKKGPVPRFLDFSPTYPANVPQSLLEPILHQRVLELAESSKKIINFNTEFCGLQQDEPGVQTFVRDRHSGAQSSIKSRYLIGADGASSAVRKALAIAFDGPPVLANFMAVHIQSDMRAILAEQPGIIFFVKSLEIDGFFIMHQANGSQVLMLRYNPDLISPKDFDADKGAAAVRAALGCEHPFKISSIGHWVMSAQVAETYRRGRVFLAGDAAHRFPPTGGLGLNTGVEDVENLIWKLAAVLRGRANEMLLDSYTLECRPIALRNCAQSVANFKHMAEVMQAIGADKDEAAFRQSLEELRGEGAAPRFAAIQQAVDHQAAHFTHLGVEMAAPLEAGAFVPAQRAIGSPVPPLDGFAPSFAPGKNLPHLWLEDDRSTLDLLEFGAFLLLVPQDQLASWQRAVKQLPQDLMEVKVHGLAASNASARATAQEFYAGNPFAILVRPDGRIAWLEPQELTDPTEELAGALRTICGLAPITPEKVAAI
jgi:2,4-dichlorophenol 6-monooxygenase